MRPNPNVPGTGGVLPPGSPEQAMSLNELADFMGVPRQTASKSLDDLLDLPPVVKDVEFNEGISAEDQ